MTLATHAVFGAGIAQIFPNHPIVGFGLGFASHFALDAIPHWDYKILSLQKKNESDNMTSDMKVDINFFYDFLRIGSDFSIGIILSLLFFANDLSTHSIILALAGAIGGVLPDFLQFVYFKLRCEPLISLQKFHIFIHAKKKLDDYPKLGFSIQAIAVFLISFVK